MNDDKKDEEEMVEEKDGTQEAAGSEDTETMLTDAVAACFAEGGDAAGLEGDEAIDAVIAKLESMKGGASNGGGLPGMGNTGGPMDIGEPVA